MVLGKTCRRGSVVGALLVIACVSGCVPYEEYADLRQEHERVLKAHQDLAANYNRLLSQGAVGQADAGRLDALQATLRDRDGEIQILKARLDETESSGRRFAESISSEIPGAEVGRSGQIVLGEAILFSPGSAALTSAGQKTLDQLARLLERDHRGESFVLVGHTDDTPLDRTKNLYEYNVRLGFERAYTVFKYLNLQHAFAEPRFRILTAGYTEPTDPVDRQSPAARSRNRRVEIFLAAGD